MTAVGGFFFEFEPIPGSSAVRGPRSPGLAGGGRPGAASGPGTAPGAADARRRPLGLARKTRFDSNTEALSQLRAASAALPLTAQRRLARRRSGHIRTASLRQLPRPRDALRGRPARALRPPKSRRASHEPMKIIVPTAGTTVALRPLGKIRLSVRDEVAALLGAVRASVDTRGNDHA